MTFTLCALYNIFCDEYCVYKYKLNSYHKSMQLIYRVLHS